MREKEYSTFDDTTGKPVKVSWSDLIYPPSWLKKRKKKKVEFEYRI